MWEFEENNGREKLVVLTARCPKEREGGEREGGGGIVNEMGREAWEQQR